MATLSSIITPSNVETASSTSTLTNKTISGSSNTITNVPLSTAVTGTLPIANGGTGTSSTTFANLTTNVTGTLPVANGGTGAASLTANNVILGNGTSAVQVVAPGSSGNLLTSNGTTWQSTAPAPSGGSVTATASGAITSSAAAVVNSDGTVSAITPTAGSGSTLSSATVNPTTYPSVGGYGGKGVVVYGSKTGASVAFYVGSSGANSYVYASIGTFNGTSFTWSAPFTVYAAYTYSIFSGAFDSANNRYWCLAVNQSNYSVFIGVELKSDGTYNSAFNIAMNSYAGDTVSAPTMAVNASGTKGVVSYYANSYGYLFTYGFSFTTNSPYITQGNEALLVSNPGNYQTDTGMKLTVNTDGSRAVILWCNSSGYPTASLISITSNNATQLSTTVITSNNEQYPYGVVYNSVEDKYVAVWGTGAGGWNSKAATLTVSGSSVSIGTILTGGLPLPYVSPLQVVYNPTLNNVMVFGSTSSNSLTISGTTLTAGSGVTFSPNVSANVGGTSLLSDSYAQIMWPYSSSIYTMQVTIARPYTTTLTATNFLGISDATYSNGQTATIKTVGSTKNGFSNLTAGVKYNVNGTGNLQPFYAIGGSYAGLAVSSTTLLIKG